MACGHRLWLCSKNGPISQSKTLFHFELQKITELGLSAKKIYRSYPKTRVRLFLSPSIVRLLDILVPGLESPQKMES